MEDDSCSLTPTTLSLCVPGKVREIPFSLPAHVVTLLAGIGVEVLCFEVVQPRSLFVMHGSFVHLAWMESSVSHFRDQGGDGSIRNGATFWSREGQGHRYGV